MAWWDETDKIEIPQIESKIKLPPPMSFSYAWPESIDAHWDRIWNITQEAKANHWKYKGLLPYKKKFLSIYRKAFDGQKVPRWASNMCREELFVSLCVDENRRPIEYQDAIKPLEKLRAEGLAFRDARSYLQREIKNERLGYHEETVEAVKQFRDIFIGKLAMWEWANPNGTSWYNCYQKGLPMYIAKVAQNIQNVNRNKLTITMMSPHMRQKAATYIDFRAWFEDDIFYVTEFPYIDPTNRRKLHRVRFRIAEGHNSERPSEPNNN